MIGVEIILNTIAIVLRSYQAFDWLISEFFISRPI